MMLAGLKAWMERLGSGEAPLSPADVAAVPAVEPITLPAGPSQVWPPGRVAAAEALWGEGFILPGGPEETLRLARSLGLREDATLLLLGAGLGGPARAIAESLGCWVAGFEQDPDLAAIAGLRALRAGPAGRRATISPWNPAAPVLRTAYHHHAVLLEPLRGAQPEPVLSAVTRALKPHAQLALVELVAESTPDPTREAWARLEWRAAELPKQETITRMLGRLGYEVRVAEDISERHVRLALAGWTALVESMEARRPEPRLLAAIVTEAERWLLRLRLLRGGQLRLLRWHALRRVASA